MHKIIKINVISIVYALLLFIAIELFINVYRISRVTEWTLNVVIVVIPIIILVAVVLLTLLAIRLTKRWLLTKKAVYSLTFLLFPHFVLLYYRFSERESPLL